MIGRSSALPHADDQDDLVEQSGSDRERERESDRERFLGSHRALAACAREFTRLASSVTSRVELLRSQTGDGKPTIKLSPERCIVQLGPVALTVAWLRATLDSVADGRLLVIVWDGTVATRPASSPERLAAPNGPPRTASPVWEEVLVAAATGEGSWRWEVENDATRGYDSPELADRCVERLREALEERTA